MGYILGSKESYIKHIFNQYCGKESISGIFCIYSKENVPKIDEESEVIKAKFKSLSMPGTLNFFIFSALNA